ncbi:hypothetical protein, partial [Salmonella enterica]|uniref:hypothetical protein n=1 Tax=Salmonella enterica TaxID=28901 RepID=UPI001F2588C7
QFADLSGEVAELRATQANQPPEEEEPIDTPQGGSSKPFHGLSQLKTSVPSFAGSTDLEVYLDWEIKMERIFELHSVPEHRKAALAVVNFTDYVLV